MPSSLFLLLQVLALVFKEQLVPEVNKHERQAQGGRRFLCIRSRGASSSWSPTAAGACRCSARASAKPEPPGAAWSGARRGSRRRRGGGGGPEVRGAAGG